jgi:hypothetical protein
VHFAKHAHAQWRERGGELAGVVDDLHGRDYQLDKTICQMAAAGYSAASAPSGVQRRSHTTM